MGLGRDFLSKKRPTDAAICAVDTEVRPLQLAASETAAGVVLVALNPSLALDAAFSSSLTVDTRCRTHVFPVLT
eukprot:3172999-Amphidinium_carterae.1